MHTHQQTFASEAGTLVPFPTHRCRPPSQSPAAVFLAELRTFVDVASLADRVGALPSADLDALLASNLRDHGGDALTKILDGNTAAIAVLRALLASLIEADRRIAAAADRVLTAAGLPSEVR